MKVNNLLKIAKKHKPFIAALIILIAIIVFMFVKVLSPVAIDGRKEPNKFVSGLAKIFPFIEDDKKDELPDSAVVGYKGEKEAAGNAEEDVEETLATIDTEAGAKIKVAPEDGKLLKGEMNYVADTIYTGKSKISPRNFATKFQKSDNYINNRTTLEYMEPEIKKNMFDLANNFARDMFNIDYHTIQVDRKAYEEKLNQYFLTNGAFFLPDGTMLKPPYIITDLADWALNGKIQAESEFVTDESLIYVDEGITYIRGELTINPYSCEDDNGETVYLPAGINYKESGKYIIEIGIIYYGDGYKDFIQSPYLIQSYEVIEKLQ